MTAPKKTAQSDLHEEYYQISPAILESFPRFRLPLALYQFKEKVAALVPFVKPDQRITADQREEILDKSKQGVVFVARQDHPVYAKHIGKQLDLVLVDTNLKPSEIAYIFQHALTERMEEFLNQPVQPVLEKLHSDILVLTEYLWEDPYRIKEIRKHLWPKHSLANHCINCLFMGLALYSRMNDGQLRRKILNETALGLALHDVGMSKIPAFILQKTTPLTREELEKVREHCWIGSKMLNGLDIRSESIIKPAMEHHERLDGKGYPQKLSDKQISIPGQLCAVVDSFCAQTTVRPYAPAMPPDQALNELMQHTGYNTKFVRALQAMIMG